MNQDRHVKLIHEGEYVAEVQITLTDDDAPWGPYLSIEDAKKMDEVRLALRRGDLRTAMGAGRIYRLTPITAA